LDTLAYTSGAESHIKLFWPLSLERREELRNSGVWHLCPARVYEYPEGQLHPVLNYENCVKCESCWRASDAVDWTRNRRQEVVFQTRSPVDAKLLDRLASLDPPVVRPPRFWHDASRKTSDEEDARRQTPDASPT